MDVQDAPQSLHTKEMKLIGWHYASELERDAIYRPDSFVLGDYRFDKAILTGWVVNSLWTSIARVLPEYSIQDPFNFLRRNGLLCCSVRNLLSVVDPLVLSFYPQ